MDKTQPTIEEILKEIARRRSQEKTETERYKVYNEMIGMISTWTPELYEAVKCFCDYEMDEVHFYHCGNCDNKIKIEEIENGK